MKSYIKYIVGIAIGALSTGCLMSSCSDIFDKQPLDGVSDETFWNNEADLQMALTGCYNHGSGWVSPTFWAPRTMLWLDLMAGLGSE